MRVSIGLPGGRLPGAAAVGVASEQRERGKEADDA